jgi:hypothetical protein
MTEEITKNARKTLKKNIITLLKERYKLHSHRKFKKNFFEIQKQKAKPKLKTNRK